MKQCAFSQKELDGFKRDGFIVVRQMYSRDEIGQLSDWINEIAEKPPKNGKEMENGCLELASGHHRRGLSEGDHREKYFADKRKYPAPR